MGLDIIGRIGKVINHNIDKFIETVIETRKGFNQRAFLYNSSGEDSPPVKEDRIVLLKIDGTGKFVVVGVLTESQGAKPGEKIFFSRNESGEIQSVISMFGDGTIDSKIKKDLITTIKENETRTIKKDLTETFEGNETKTVKKDLKTTIEGKETRTVKGESSLTIEGNFTLTGKGDIKEEATGEYSIKAASIKITGDTEIILATIGSASWFPNCIPTCPFGIPHGGAPGGITGLKGA